MKTFTPAIKRQIITDWHALFPQMAVHRPMWLVRRVGPLVQGICLERDSGNASYLPTTCLHSLCRPFPGISLTLGQPLLSARSGTRDRIAVQFHEHHYHDAAQRLDRASLLPLTGNLTMHQVLVAYRCYRELCNPDSKYPVHLFEDGILLFAWRGHGDRATALLNDYVEEMRRWPENVMARDGGLDSWRMKMLKDLAKPEVLRETVEAEARKLKVSDVPISQLIF